MAVKYLLDWLQRSCRTDRMEGLTIVRFLLKNYGQIVKRMTSSSVILPDSPYFSHNTSIFVRCIITGDDPFPLLNWRKWVVSYCLETIRERHHFNWGCRMYSYGGGMFWWEAAVNLRREICGSRGSEPKRYLLSCCSSHSSFTSYLCKVRTLYLKLHIIFWWWEDMSRQHMMATGHWIKLSLFLFSFFLGYVGNLSLFLSSENRKSISSWFESKTGQSNLSFDG